MNKEEIRKAKKHYILTTEHELDDNNKRLKEYIEYLEQKESILDKATDKLNEDIKNDYCTKEIIEDSYITVGVKKYSVKPYAREILNIIEGEKNNEK